MDTSQRERLRRRRILALLGAAFFMTILDSTSLLTALPSIKRDLDLSGPATQWTVTSYALAFGGLLLLCGRVADLRGRRRAFLTGIGLRVLATLICGLAPTFAVLVAARALQGASAAIIAPAALSMVMNTFPEGAERNKALGIWGSLGGVGATSGLLLGGVITDTFGWRWVFLINVPIGIAVLAVAPALLAESRGPQRTRSFDIAGALTVTAALVLLVYAIVDVPDAGWASGRFVGAGVGALVLACAFVAVESRSAAPLVPLRAVRSRSLIGGNLTVLVAGMAVDGMLITLTSYVQQALGWSAVQFGLVAAAMTVSSVAGALVSQRIATTQALRPVASAGMVLLIGACMLLTRVSAAGSLRIVLVALVIFGAGMGAAFVSSQIAALSGVAEDDSGLAAGLVDTCFTIGSALGIAICTTVAGVGTLVRGEQIAFGAAGLFAVVGLAGALTLLPRRPAGELIPA